MASLTPLFPIFVGQVRVEHERVTLVGHYAPPFGIVGAVLDRPLLGIAARATANVIVGKFIGRPRPGPWPRTGVPIGKPRRDRAPGPATGSRRGGCYAPSDATSVLAPNGDTAAADHRGDS